MRIFHGPVNICGIGGHLASYQRSQGHDAQFIVWRGNPFFQNHDQQLYCEDSSILARVWARLKLFVLACGRFDVFNFYFGITLLPFGIDLPILRLLGKKLVMIYCGSDARLVSVERERNPYWPTVEKELAGTIDSPEYDPGKRRMLAWQGFWCHRVLAPRNLYGSVSQVVPARKIVDDIWVHNLSAHPVAMRGAKSANAAEEPRPLIVHAPSSPRVKGSRYFFSAIERLREEGWEFDYLEITGLTQEQTLARLEQADIVLDQLLLGGFGSLSVEAMTLGKPVVCYVIESVRQHHYPDCPIISATIDDVTDVIRGLLRDPAARARAGAAGRQFISRHFDYEAVNQKLLALYEQL